MKQLYLAFTIIISLFLIGAQNISIANDKTPRLIKLEHASLDQPPDGDLHGQGASWIGNGKVSIVAYRDSSIHVSISVADLNSASSGKGMYVLNIDTLNYGKYHLLTFNTSYSSRNAHMEVWLSNSAGEWDFLFTEPLKATVSSRKECVDEINDRITLRGKSCIEGLPCFE